MGAVCLVKSIYLKLISLSVLSLGNDDNEKVKTRDFAARWNDVMYAQSMSRE